jgi:hypothetical protein
VAERISGTASGVHPSCRHIPRVLALPQLRDRSTRFRFFCLTDRRFGGEKEKEEE